MFEIKEKEVFLSFLDEKLWDSKTTDTGYNYYGIILDWIFENSIYCVDYLNIEDMIYSNCALKFNERKLFIDQYKNIEDKQFLKLTEVVTNVLLKSNYQYLDTKSIGLKILKFIERNKMIKILKIDEDFYEFLPNEKFNYGSYNDILEVNATTLKKIMKPEYQTQEQYVKRFKYEFEMMSKLSDSPYILKVFNYNEEENSYLMERCECDIYEYLSQLISVPDEELFNIFDCIIYGISYAHDNHIIHRDLHLGNILKIKNDFVICDFGLGKDLTKDRSLKSSSTPKNSHMFMDPIGKVDFTKLDESSDIYSIAKIIEYIIDLTSSKINLDYVIEKATSRRRDKRYLNIHEFISDYLLVKKEFDETFKEEEFKQHIKSTKINTNDIKKLTQLAESKTLSRYLLENNINNFADVVLSLPILEQSEIIKSLKDSYASATEYNRFEQYDVFARIAYDVILKCVDISIKKEALQMLEGCASYRFSAKNMLDDIKSKSIFDDTQI